MDGNIPLFIITSFILLIIAYLTVSIFDEIEEIKEIKETLNEMKESLEEIKSKLERREEEVVLYKLLSENKMRS